MTTFCCAVAIDPGYTAARATSSAKPSNLEVSGRTMCFLPQFAPDRWRGRIMKPLAARVIREDKGLCHGHLTVRIGDAIMAASFGNRG